MNEKFSSIIRSALRFLSGTSLSRVSGFTRDITMAACFGATPSVAAFLVAFRLAHLLRRVFGEGAMQTAFVPIYEKFRGESPVRADKFFLDLKGSLFFALVGLVLFAMLGIHLLFDGEIASLSVLLLPSLPFICLFGLNASLLQCHNHYFVPGVAPVAFNLIWIAGTLYLKDVPEAQAMRSLAYFVIIACIAQWAMTLPQIIPTWKARVKIVLFSQDVRSLLAPLSLAIVGVAASQINNALDAFFARYASLEGPAYLWYAIRLQQLPVALIGVALSGALLPPLSRAIHAGKLELFGSLIKKALVVVSVLMLLVTLVLVFGADPLIRIVYGHGGFSAEAVKETALCLAGYALGLIPLAWVLILSPACNAQGRYREPAIASTVSMVANIALNGIFIFGFGWGAVSIAVATSLSSFLNAALLWKVCSTSLVSRFTKQV